MAETKVCCNTCEYYRQHYIKMGHWYTETYCGHCVYPRIKKREPDHNACENYLKRRDI